MKTRSENEKIADIVEEMRIFQCRNLKTGKMETCSAIANYLADRIEAAWKRERAALQDAPRSWAECAVRADKEWNDVY